MSHICRATHKLLFLNEMYVILVSIQNIFIFLEQGHILVFTHLYFLWSPVALRLKTSIIFIISEIVYALELLISNFHNNPGRGRGSY